jgi:hypothetical protein
MLDPGLVKITLTLLSLAGIGITFLSFPGIVLIFISVLLYGWYTNFTEPTVNTIVIVGLITLMSFWIDNLAALFGAKKFGASKLGMLGAFLGGLFGFLVIGPPGFVIGPLLGAVIGELIVNKELKTALRTGFGTFIGYLFGMFLKLIVTVIMFIWALTVIW